MGKDVSKNCSLIISPPSKRSWTRSSAHSINIHVGALVFAVFAGCGPGVRHATLPGPSIHSNGQSEIVQDGITISVRPITWETASQFPEIVRTYSAPSARGRVDAHGPLLPLPAFAVTVTNGTEHTVQFNQSPIRLSADGNTYDALDRDGATAWATSSWRVAIQAGVPASQIESDVRALHLFDRTVELLPGDHRTYYLALDLGEQTIDATDTVFTNYRRIVDGVERFTLRIAEVPVEFNEAGAATRRTQFVFNFDRTQYDQAVACRGSAAPSWATCSRE